jgi:hypothetical protein
VTRKDNFIYIIPFLSVFLLNTYRSSGEPVLTGDVNMGGNSNMPFTFTTETQLLAGGTAEDYITIQFHVTDQTYVPGWTLKVRASDSFRNVSDMESSLRPDFVSLAFNRIDLGQPLSSSSYVTQLSTSEMTLVSHEQTPLQQFEGGYNIRYTFNMVISGGEELLNLSNGNYMTSLDFFLYDSAGSLISTATIPNVFFKIQVDQDKSLGIKLKNDAASVDLNFFNANDYAEGVRVFIQDALRIKGKQRYSVYIRSNSDNMVSKSGNSIPVSAVKVAITSNDPEEHPGIIITSPVILSSAAMQIIRNTQEEKSSRNTSYNLEFYTEGGDPSLLSCEGTYSAVLYFLLLPE